LFPLFVARRLSSLRSLLAAIAALLIARIPVIFVRAFDSDEFEHGQITRSFHC
jgi:hypothetical protein